MPKTPPPRREWTGKRVANRKGKLVPPPGAWNTSRRPRGEHLTHDEIEAVCAAAGAIGRNRLRDSTMIWVGFVHGLRACELVGLKLEQYEMKSNRLTVHRVKDSRTSIHTVKPREKAALKNLVGDRRNGFVFLNERGKPLSTSGFLKIVARAGREAVDKDGEPIINFPVHPHMLRHSCGHWLNQRGASTRAIQEWLGHKNMRHTERYTAHSPEVFERFEF
jgi:integrase